MQAHDLDPRLRSGADLIDAIWAAYREDRRDLHNGIAALITHEDPIVREEVLSLLLVKWSDVRHRSLAVNCLLEDEDFGVRGRAALGLSSVSTERSRAKDLRLLISVLRNNDEESGTRRAAYEAILLLLGRSDFPRASRSFDAERDVDWELIASLTHETEAD